MEMIIQPDMGKIKNKYFCKNVPCGQHLQSAKINQFKYLASLSLSFSLFFLF